MAQDVLFKFGTAAQYSAVTKDSKTFYYTTDDHKVYLGEIELSNTNIDAKVGNLADLNTTAKNTIVAAINEVLANEGALSALTTDAKNTLIAAINEVDSHADTNATAIGDISTLDTTAKTNLVAAINEVKGDLDDLTSDSKVSLEVAGTATEGYLKTYELYQGEQEGKTLVGKIDIPKDMVVQSGRVVTNPQGQPEGTYIELTLANNNGTKIYINVANLVDIYTAAQGATQVQLAINGYEISATLVDGGVSTAKLADDAITTVKIADGNVTKVKLAQSVQDSLDLADSALQAADIAEGATNGTIAVEGTDVAVHGLGSAAYTDSDAYDPSGSAAAVLGTNADTAATVTVYGTRKYAEDEADAAEAAANTYTDNALTWQSI